MIGFESKISGFKDFDKLLGELPRNVENRVLQNATTQAMRDGTRAMRDAAPVSEGYRSPISKKFGRLKRNIKVKRLKRVAKGQKAARIDTGKSPQGFWFERGTRHQPARPWFLPAFSRASGAIIASFTRRLSDGIYAEIDKLKRLK